MKYRVFFLLALLFFTAAAAFHLTAVPSGTAMPGIWLQTTRADANQYACQADFTCVEWCYLGFNDAGEPMPSGQTCCVADSELPSDNYNDCWRPIPR